MALATFHKRRTAKRYTLIDRAVVSNLCGLSNHNAHPMIDKHTLAELGPRMNLNPRQPTGDHGNQSGEPLQKSNPAAPELMCQTMQPQGMQARISGQNLKAAAGRRIAVQNGLDIFS